MLRCTSGEAKGIYSLIRKRDGTICRGGGILRGDVMGCEGQGEAGLIRKWEMRSAKKWGNY